MGGISGGGKNEDQYKRPVTYGKIEEVRQLIMVTYVNSRERSLALNKLEESELWLTRCREMIQYDYGI